jgi:hypothetical protein
MAWQPPPPPPRPGQGGPAPAPEAGPKPNNGQQQQQGQSPQGQSPQAKAAGDLNFYELLQVDRDAHATIIRYAYRFLAAMYHPDNGETGNAEKFRIVSEAWRTLSDEGKRAAYDMSLGVKEASKASSATQKTPQQKSEFGRQGLPNIPKTNLTWNEIELRIAVLQVLLAARRQNPKTGGASGKMLMDCLNIDNVTDIEFALWYLREKGFAEMGERAFTITAEGLDYLTDALSKTQVLGGQSAMEKKTSTVVPGGVPAIIPREQK